MIRRVTILITLMFFVLSALPSAVMADRKRLKKPSEQRKTSFANISESKSMLIGFVSAGKLSGKVTEYVDELKDQIVYGAGLGFEHYLLPKIGLGAEIRFMWLTKMEILPDQIQTTEYRLFSIYRFSPLSARTVYLKLGVGKTSGKMGELASADRTQIRLALGLLSFSSGKFNSRVEFSYNSMLNNDDEVLYMGINYPYNLDYLALDFGLGLPL